MKSNTFVQIVMLLTLVLFTRSTFAQQRQFNDWVVGQTTSGPCALTGSSRGKLVLYRLGTSYLWVLEQTSLNCTDNSRISVLISTNGGSANTEVVCHRDGNTQFIFSDTALVTRTLQQATQVRIDVPIENGSYSFDFSLLGMSNAVT